MLYLACFALLGWAATSCLLVVLFLRALREGEEQHAAERKSHREEIAALNQARIEEVAGLLQRIQAPEVAVAQHSAQDALPDPPPLDLEDDRALIDEYERRLSQYMTEVQ